jgi:hypothetical protein
MNTSWLWFFKNGFQRILHGQNDAFFEYVFAHGGAGAPADL